MGQYFLEFFLQLFSEILDLLFCLVGRGLFFYSWIFVFYNLITTVMGSFVVSIWTLIFLKFFFPDFLFLMFFWVISTRGKKYFFFFI